MSQGAAYLDASALVKLFKPEAETAALEQELGSYPAWISSELAAVEARCAARRVLGGDLLPDAEEALRRIDLVTLSPPIRERAGAAFHRPLRALDAIHGATILALGDRVATVFAYDLDLRAAVAAEGLEVLAPGAA